MQNVARISPIVTGNRFKFVVASDGPVSVTEAKAIQNPDYPIAGYGFYAFQSVKQPNGSYQTTWYCSSHCD